MPQRLDFIQRANAAYIEQQYQRYRQDPASVPEDWALFFAGFDLAENPARAPHRAQPNGGIFALVHAYREFGHLVATLDPLGGSVGQLGQLLRRERLGGHEQQRLDRMGELTHAIARSPSTSASAAAPAAATTLIGANSRGCSGTTSPRLIISSSARNAAACDRRSSPFTASSNWKPRRVRHDIAATGRCARMRSRSATSSTIKPKRC